MANPFAQGKRAIAVCDRCGFQYKLVQLRELVIKNTPINMLVCNSCWEESHPQLMQGEIPIYDPQALQRARPDSSYVVSGVTVTGTLGEGSRDTQWGWNPIGGGNSAFSNTPNLLEAQAELGDVTVTIA